MFSTTCRKLITLKNSALEFLQKWLENTKTSRDDHLEVVQLTYIFLGGAQLFDFSIRAPGAFHYARWMGRIIYCIKIALFRNQVLDLELISEEKLNHICSLASFLSLYYVQYRCTAPFLADASVNDLELWKKFKSLKKTSPNIGGESGRGGALAHLLFFQGGSEGALIYAFISTILPLHECI